MNKIVFIFLVSVLLLVSFAVPCFAEEYSLEYPELPYSSMILSDYGDEYPNLYNSGSPLWIHCQIHGMGEYVIVVDPNTNPQAFGFDAPTGYNLINNTGSTIVGRAYHVESSTAYNARWTSFYKLQLQTGSPSYGSNYTYEDYNITAIYGTTFDLIDYVGDRGNDAFKHDIPDNQYRIIVVSAVAMIVLLFALFMLIKPRLLRM